MRPIVVADGPGAPAVDPLAIAARLGVTGEPLFLGWTPEDRPWIDSLPARAALTFHPGAALRDAVARGSVEYLPIRLKAIPAFLRHARPSVAVVPVVRRGDGFAFTRNVGYMDTAARLADAVVVEVVDGEPDLGAPAVEGNIVEVLEGGRRPAPQRVVETDEVDAAVARLAARLIPAGATVQYGVGGLPDAVVRAIDVPVSVLSGLIGAAVGVLADRGLLQGETLACYAFGDDSLAALAAEGRYRPVGLEELHAGDRFASSPSLVAVNAALQVGLDGAVNVERVGGRAVAGVGGHADYSGAATRSPGGFSLVVLRASHRGRSTIVATPEVVSTPRADVQVVVTERGVADLRGLTEAGRREALLAISDPELVAGQG